MIVSASYTAADPQKDGRYYVTETQVDDQAGEIQFQYLAEADADPESIMNARTAALNAG